jgi:hypothetical protein
VGQRSADVDELKMSGKTDVRVSNLHAFVVSNVQTFKRLEKSFSGATVTNTSYDSKQKRIFHGEI